jgi:hypothetical protein
MTGAWSRLCGSRTSRHEVCPFIECSRPGGLRATGSANARPLYQRETLVQFCAWLMTLS